MQATHAYYSSQVLRDGRVYVGGGEYGNGSQQAEFYQPTNNTWTRNDPGSAFPGSPDVNNYGASGLLPNGNVIVATFTAPKPPGTRREYTVIYDVTSNTWSVGPKMIEFTDEGTFVKLPDDSLLTLDINGVTAERYIPALNKWIVDAPRPVVLYNDYGEMGGGYMLPNGKLIFLGGTSHTAIYTPSGTTNAGTWTAGADFPYERGMSDAPSAMMVNGKILCAASPNNLVGGDTQYFEYDYVANAFTQLSSPFGGTNYGAATFIQTMMPLPDGTVLYCSFYGGTSRLYARWFASGGW